MARLGGACDDAAAWPGRATGTRAATARPGGEGSAGLGARDREEPSGVESKLRAAA